MTDDAVLELARDIELPEGHAELPTGGPDRLGELAAWWRLVSTAPAPARATLAWGGPAEPSGLLTPAPDDVPATTAEAIAWGAGLADAAIDSGTDLVVLHVPVEPVPGEDLPAHLLLTSHLLQVDPVEATGWPGPDGLDDDAWTVRIAALRDARRAVRGVYGEPERLLGLLGSPWLAAGAGLLARATSRRTPVLLDGAAAVAVAVLVRRSERAGRGWWQAIDGGDGLHQRAMKELRLRPLLDLGLDAHPGAGARLGLAVLREAVGGTAVGPDASA